MVFPVDHDKIHGSSQIRRNHKGATEFHTEVKQLVNKEVRLNATLGPFKSVPFSGKYCISPLNTVPKKDSVDRRLILDLSCPEGNSVNDGISKDWYLGKLDKLQFPSVDNLVSRVMEIGKGALLFKVDLSRAYRQAGVNPGEIPILGFFLDGNFYFDSTLSMGGRNSARSCQRITSAVVFIFSKHGFFAVNYLDDLGSAETEERAQQAFEKLRDIIRLFGLKEAVDKAASPSTLMVFLGLLINSIDLTITIPPRKLEEILQEVRKWRNKTTASLKEVQILAGQLNFACKCVRSGRVYLSRILNFLREFNNSKSKIREVSDELKQDIAWWDSFASKFNGVSMMLENEWSKPDKLMASDSCLTGGGAYFLGRYFHWKFPEQIVSKKFSINVLELMVLVVTVKKWAKHLVSKKVVFKCDNLNTVRWINSGASRVIEAQSLIRHLHEIMGLFSFDLRTEFIEGQSNRLPDLLSRYHLNGEYKRLFRTNAVEHELEQEFIEESDWSFLIDIGLI